MENNEIIRILANARFKTRSDTRANWEALNPVLLSGEPAIVTDGSETEKIKLGDGVTPWNELGWWKGPKGEQGIQGIKGEKGEAGKDAVTDQSYNPESENAQSGKAVAEAIKAKVDRNEMLDCLTYKVVDRLPEKGVPNKIYLVPELLEDAEYQKDSIKYRYSTIYDFENMTDEQAQLIFEYSKFAKADISIVCDGADKALQIKANTAFLNYNWYRTRYILKDVNIPNDKHCVGIRIQYEGINLNGGRIGFIKQYGDYNWTDINMLEPASTPSIKIGERDVTVFFKDDTQISLGETHTLNFELLSASDDELPGIKIFKIEFLYDDIIDKYTMKALRDYEDKDEGIICATNNETITVNNDSDISVTGYGRVGTSSYAYVSGTGQNASKGLKRITNGVSWHIAQILKINKEVISSPKVIGMRIWVQLKQKASPRIQVKINGYWSTLQFNSPKNMLSSGAHDIVVMFDNLVAANADGNAGANLYYDFNTIKSKADSYLCIDDGSNNEIVFDNIELICNENGFYGYIWNDAGWEPVVAVNAPPSNNTFIIDNRMSDLSENLVPNKIIKKYVDQKLKDLSDKIDSLYLGNST